MVLKDRSKKKLKDIYLFKYLLIKDTNCKNFQDHKSLKIDSTLKFAKNTLLLPD